MTFKINENIDYSAINNMFNVNFILVDNVLLYDYNDGSIQICLMYKKIEFSFTANTYNYCMCYFSGDYLDDNGIKDSVFTETTIKYILNKYLEFSNIHNILLPEQMKKIMILL